MTTRDAVLRALREAAPDTLSGEHLAEKLGVSRVAVAKHVATLREAGYRIESLPRVGYRLDAVPDAPLPAEVRGFLGEQMWGRLEGGGVTGSTNDDARELARAGAPEGTVVLASRQTGGRGRLGRSWESPEGGAYLSMVLRPPVAPVQVSSLALVVAIGVADGLATLGVDAQLKWPNDVWIDGRKVAGILLEMSGEADSVDWVVAGVGVNVRPPHSTAETPDAVGPVAQPLDEVGSARGSAYVEVSAPGVGVAQVAAAVLDGIAVAYRCWLDEGFSALTQRFEARSVLTGHEVTVRDIAGRVLAAGRVSGVDADGRLMLETPAGLQGVSAGEVTLRDE